VCPEQLECTQAAPFCATHEAITDCAMKNPWDACGTGGSCHGGVCEPCQADRAGCAGPGWTAMTSGTDKELDAVWVVARGDAYVAGDSGTLLHYDGEHWSPVATTPPLDPQFKILSLVGLDATTLFALAESNHLYRITGTTASLETLPSGADTLVGLGGTPPDQLYAVGASGTVLHFDGTAWQQLDATMFGSSTIFNEVSAQSGHAIAAGLLGAVAQLDGSWTESQPLPPPFTNANLTGTWIAANGDRFVAGISTGQNMPTLAYAHGATGWQPVPATGFPGGTNLRAVWGTSPTDVWAGGDSNKMIHFDGTAGTLEDLPTDVTRIDAIGGDATRDVYAVGASGTILQLGD
jgi:hypothetical protein